MNKKLIKNKKSEDVDLFWKSRDFKPWDKSVDWYWVFWIIVLSFMGILIYFFDDYIFSILIFLIATTSVIGHRKNPTVTEYRINNEAVIIDNGKREIKFENIKSFNIDYNEGYIFINTKEKYAKLISIPFEHTHNISIIEKILSSKIEKDESLDTPFMEKIINRMLGF